MKYKSYSSLSSTKNPKLQRESHSHCKPKTKRSRHACHKKRKNKRPCQQLLKESTLTLLLGNGDASGPQRTTRNPCKSCERPWWKPSQTSRNSTGQKSSVSCAGVAWISKLSFPSQQKSLESGKKKSSLRKRAFWKRSKRLTEYLSWRLKHSPSCPSIFKMKNLKPAKALR